MPTTRAEENRPDKLDDPTRLPDWVVFVNQVLSESKPVNISKAKEGYA